MLLTSLTLVCAFRRRRNKSLTQDSNQASSSEPATRLGALAVAPTQEIGHNSLQIATLELQDSGRVELLDGQAPSGSGNPIHEAPESVTPALDRATSLAHSRLTPSMNNPHVQNRIFNLTPRDIANEDKSSKQPAALSSSTESPMATLPRRLTQIVNKPLPPLPLSVYRAILRSHHVESETSSNANYTSDGAVRTVSLSNKQASIPVPTSRFSNTTSISESPQVSPMMPPAGRRFLPRNSFGSIQSQAVSMISTYATIFDYEEYNKSSASGSSPRQFPREHELS